jgi:D-alanyl-D-alanine endopeptidase (penicillin-binding protein 7)
MKSSLFSFVTSFVMMLAGVAMLAGLSLMRRAEPLIALSCPPEQCVPNHEPFVVPAPVALPLVNASPTPVFLGTFTASATLAVDDETGAILWDVSSTATRPLASITKLMSALILSELPVPWQATTTITEADSDGSNTHLKVGETYTLKTLWQVALVGSSNTAVNALVRMSGIPRSEFVARMNAKALRLKMTGLHFVEPTGLDPRNVGTARDVARLLRFALRNDSIRPVLERESVMLRPPGTSQPRVVWSTNWLLTQWIPHGFATPTVGKTGYIGDAGYNFTVRVADESGHALRIVVLGAGASENRFTEAKAIGEWVFGHTTWPSPAGPALQMPLSTSSMQFSI